MILLYPTKAEAEAALAALEDAAKQLWADAGYTVDGDSVIGKNARTDQDEPAKQRIVRWDKVKQHPDGGYYFASPRNKYPEYFDQLVGGNYQEVDSPQQSTDRAL